MSRMNPFLNQPSRYNMPVSTTDRKRHSLEPEIYLQLQLAQPGETKLLDPSSIAVLHECHISSSNPERSNIGQKYTMHVHVVMHSEQDTSSRERNKNLSLPAPRVLGRHDHLLEPLDFAESIDTSTSHSFDSEVMESEVNKSPSSDMKSDVTLQSSCLPEYSERSLEGDDACHVAFLVKMLAQLVRPTRTWKRT
jgi:hypothetical protein